MNHYQLRRRLAELSLDADTVRERYLRACGWRHTSDTPGCFWLWIKTIGGVTYAVSEEHALRMAESASHERENRCTACDRPLDEAPIYRGTNCRECYEAKREDAQDYASELRKEDQP